MQKCALMHWIPRVLIVLEKFKVLVLTLEFRFFQMQYQFLLGEKECQHFGLIQSIQSIWVLFTPHCSYLVYSAHVSPIRSIRSILSTLVHLGHILHSFLFGLFWSYSVHFGPIQSTSVYIGCDWSICPICSFRTYSVHISPIQ